MDFQGRNLAHELASADPEALDRADFGVIGFDSESKVCVYNHLEARLSGYARSAVIGRNLFTEVAPCLNNYLVSLKFEGEQALDEVLPYVFSFKVRPVPVELRLLRTPGAPVSWLLIRRL
jgi:photoactive yellow protein